MSRTLLSIVLAGALCSSAAMADYKEVRTLTLKKALVDSFTIDVGAGDLEITSQKGIDEITVVAKIVVGGYSDSYGKRFVESNVKLDLTTQGSTGHLVSDIDNDSSGWFSRLVSGGGHAYVDLEIIVPEGVSLKINDSSGDVLLQNLVQNVSLDDSSGDVTIKNHVGSLKVDDSSGDLHIVSVRGSVRIDDSSGDTTVREVTGDVWIDDGSGDIRFEEIDGSVDVSDDGSGDIRISRVSGNVHLGDTGSGDVHLASVSGVIER